MKARKKWGRSEYSSASEEEDSPVCDTRKMVDEQNDLMHAQHPLETTGLLNGKMLSVTQRAMICCINKNGGSASEKAILRFLKKHWQFIRKNSAKDYRDTANCRVLRINLNSKKNGHNLFWEPDKGSGVWALTQTGETKSTRTPKFDDRILTLLREHEDGMTIEELVAESREFMDLDGMFKELLQVDPTGARRIRALLVVARRDGKVVYNEEMDKWAITSDRVQVKKTHKLPDWFGAVKIGETTVSELYKMMKRSHESVV